MCGILGGNFKNWDFEKALKSMYHRGPDNSNIVLGDFIFGFNRLSIIDLEKRSNQPLLSGDNNISIVFNGEIYGFRKLRKELEALGHTFRTKSDTEVILNAYLEWKDDFINRIDGMFAMAIYDKLENKVKIYRDRPGIKPLYYYSEDNLFAFSSELKGIKSLIGEDNLTVDKTSIYDYLTYLYIPTPKTIFENVKKLPPGHCLFFDCQSSAIEFVKPYWSLPSTISRHTESEINKQKIKTLIQESISDQLISDVPLGFFLSGGLDSSVIVGEASHLSSSKLQTFTIKFDNLTQSEADSAKIVAKKFNTKHKTFTLSPILNSLLFKKMKTWYDEPYADTSACPSFLVSLTSKRSVTVALSGDGGDELFGGYKWYKHRKLNLSDIPFSSKIKNSLIKIKSCFRYNSLLYKFFNRLSKFFMDDLELHAKMMGGLVKDEKESYRKRLKIKSDYDDYWYFRKFWVPELSYLNRLRYLDFNTYLHDDILTKVDRVSMAVSLEVRVPLLSRKLIEYCFSLPEKSLFINGELKGLIKYSYNDFLPDEIIKKPKKGFSIPVSYKSKKTSVQEFLLKKVFHRYMPSEIK